MKVVALTDSGRRENNEDNFFKYTNDKLFGGFIADGMGGHNKGDYASKLACDVIKDYIMTHFELTMDSFDISELARAALIKANDKIFQMSVKNPICKGMGTTATLALVFDEWLITAHVGDSRVYVINDEKIVKVTHDHSFVDELIEKGAITEEEAKRHPKRNYITRAVGPERSIVVDINTQRYNGETVLICSDGLWAFLDEEDIKKTVLESETLDQAAENLIELALLKNSNDNISVVLFKR